jgi:hypothetical protein
VNAHDTVITTDASDRYHHRDGCGSLDAGQHGSEGAGRTAHPRYQLTVAEAEQKGRTACPTCL